MKCSVIIINGLYILKMNFLIGLAHIWYMYCGGKIVHTYKIIGYH